MPLDPNLPSMPCVARHTHPFRDPLTLGGQTSHHSANLTAGAACRALEPALSALHLLILEVTYF